MNYGKLHKPILTDAVDMISLDTIRPTARNYIMSLVIADRKEQGVVIPRVPITLVPYDTLSAYDTYIVNGITTDVKTREVIRPSFVTRIRLYYESIQTFGADFEPSNDVLHDLFRRYVMNDVLTAHETLYLRSFLHVDNTKVIHEVPVVGLEIRTQIEAILRTRGVGSWTLRRSSYGDSTLVTSKCVSFVHQVQMESGIEIHIGHVVIFHVSGLGYYQCGTMKRGATMPSLGTPLSLPEIEGTIYPCFLDLLKQVQERHHLTMYIQ